jgi:hypothetical protein
MYRRPLMLVALLIAGFGLFYYLVIFHGIYLRHELLNDKIMVAYHIALPGYDEVVEPENVIDLTRWSGTHYDGITVATEDGVTNKEATAGVALQFAGLYNDHKMVEQNGHFVLYKPEKRTRQFNWTHWYRISSWRLPDQQ